MKFRVWNVSLLVGTDGQVYGIERERLLVQNRQLARAFVLPTCHVGKVSIIALSFTVCQLVLQTEVCTAGLLTVERIIAKHLSKIEESSYAPSLLELLIHTFCAADHLNIGPELLADGRNLLDSVHEGLLGTAHADILPHKLTELAVNFIGGLGTLNIHHLLDTSLHLILSSLELGSSRSDAAGFLSGKVRGERSGDDEITVGKALHESGSTKAVSAVVREVSLTEHMQTGDRGHEVVVHPQTTHGVVGGGVNHHRLLVGIHVGNFLIHLEEVAILTVNPLLTHAVNGILEVQEHAAAGIGNTALVVTSLLSGTGRDIARSQVTERGILALQVVVAVILRNIGGLHLTLTNLGSDLTALGHPNTAIVTQRLGHKSQLALVITLNRDAGGVNLGEAGISEVCTALPTSAGSTHVTTHSVGGKEEHTAVAAGCKKNGITGIALNLTGHHITHHNTLSVAINHNKVHHFRARVHLDVPFADFFLHGLVATEQQLLTGLTTAIESTLELRTTEGAVIKQATVFATEGNALSHTLVDNVAGHLSQTVHVGLTGTEVATLHGIIEQAVHGVTVILIVMSSIHATLCSNGVSTTGAILVAEALYIVAELCKSSSGGATGKAGTHDENGILTAVIGVNELSLALVFGPLLCDGAIRNAGIRHVVAYGKLDFVHNQRCICKGLFKDTQHYAHGNGNKATAHGNTEKVGNNVVKGANLTRGKTKSLQYGLQTMAHVHEKAANGYNVEQRAHGILECSNDVIVAIMRVAIESKLPEVEYGKAENHNTGNHHSTGRESRLEGILLAVVSAGIVVLILEHQSKHNVNKSHGQQAQTNGPEKPGRH